MFLSQSFTILKNMLLDLDFYVFVMFFVFLTVKVQMWVMEAYQSEPHVGKVLTFKPQARNLNFGQTTCG